VAKETAARGSTIEAHANACLQEGGAAGGGYSPKLNAVAEPIAGDAQSNTTVARSREYFIAEILPPQGYFLARLVGRVLFVRLLPEKGGIALIPTTEFEKQNFDGSPKEIPPDSACQENPSYANHGIFPSENVSWKGNGKVGQQDECEQYSQELKAGYQNADIARQTGQKVNRRQHVAPGYRSGHVNRISIPVADSPSPQRYGPQYPASWESGNRRTSGQSSPLDGVRSFRYTEVL
jgi:hypothetical protein